MSSTILWSDPSLPVAIHCAPGVLTGLEMAAADGLLAMPRIGLGVGGFLLGRRGNGCLYVLQSREIACSHARGPGFALTADEELAAKTPDPQPHEAGLEIVGW